jgi:hypothetical protein
VRDRKGISAIACRRADATNHGGASIAPPGTDKVMFVQSINARQVPHKFINEVACYSQEMEMKSKHIGSNESIREIVAHNRQQKIEVQ